MSAAERVYVAATSLPTGFASEAELERAETEALEEAQTIVANDGADHAFSIPGTRPGIVAPCEDCAHRIVCSIRPALEADVAIDLGAVVLPSGTRVALVSIECDHYLERVAEPAAIETIGSRRSYDELNDKERALLERARAFSPGDRLQDAPERVTTAEAPTDTSPVAAAVGRPWRNGTAKLPRDRDEREALVLGVVRSTSSQKEAGERLGVTDGRVGQIIQEMRREGRLPSDVDELMRSRARPDYARRAAAQAVPA